MLGVEQAGMSMTCTCKEPPSPVQLNGGRIFYKSLYKSLYWEFELSHSSFGYLSCCWETPGLPHSG